MKPAAFFMLPFSANGGMCLLGSPTLGFSILITSAPASASNIVQYGPAIYCSKPITLIPSSGLIILFLITNPLYQGSFAHTYADA